MQSLLCTTRSSRTRKSSRATAASSMRALPIHVAEVYLLHHRIVDIEGYLHVQRSRYSAPYLLIGRSVEVRETKDRVEIVDGPRHVGSHEKVLEPLDPRLTDPAHRRPRTAAARRRARASAPRSGPARASTISSSA